MREHANRRNERQNFNNVFPVQFLGIKFNISIELLTGSRMKQVA